MVYWGLLDIGDLLVPCPMILGEHLYGGGSGGPSLMTPARLSYFLGFCGGGGGGTGTRYSTSDNSEFWQKCVILIHGKNLDRDL